MSMPDSARALARLSDEQVADFARVLTEHLAPGSVAWLARSVLGPDEKEAANEVGDAAAYARRVAEVLNGKGLVPDAVALLGQDAHRNGRLMFRLNHVLAGKRLDDEIAYQAFLNDVEPFFSTAASQALLALMQRRVCAIALGDPDNEIVGSGFLVGADLVMTNYHVLATFLRVEGDTVVANGPGDQIFCIFDYISPPPPAIPPGRSTHACVAVQAAAAWLVGARQSLPDDGTAKSSAAVTDKYDYVVIKLAEPVGGRPARLSGGALRGWLTLPEEIDVISRGRVFVFQHPGKEHQLWDVGDYVDLDPSRTRVWYSVSTARGSSGGAAVDSSGKLFALHNAEVTHAPGPRRVNQGVRIDLIRKDLAAAAPTALVAEPPEATPLSFWSLADDIRNPSPIIGRKGFREKVTRMLAPGGARLMRVTGVPNSGVQFSIKVLQRTVGTQPIAKFTPEQLQTFTPEQFLDSLVTQLAVRRGGDPPIPEPHSSEAIPRWLAIDLPRWLLDRLTAQEKRDPSRFPAWVVMNTVMPPNQSFVWAKDLDDCIGALMGVQNVGHPATDLPQLRWLFLGSIREGAFPDGLPIAGINLEDDRLENDMALKQEFSDCIQDAWNSLGNKVKSLGDALGPSSIAAAAILTPNPSLPIRKHLATFLRNMILDTVSRVGDGQ